LLPFHHIAVDLPSLLLAEWITDIWDADAIKTLKQRYPTFFSSSDNLVLMFTADGFLPFGKSKAKHKRKKEKDITAEDVYDKKKKAKECGLSRSQSPTCRRGSAQSWGLLRHWG
jgi:hypothetical protein